MFNVVVQRASAVISAVVAMLSAALIFAFGAGPAAAQERYPSKPVKFIISQTAGSGGDGKQSGASSWTTAKMLKAAVDTGERVPPDLVDLALRVAERYATPPARALLLGRKPARRKSVDERA